MRPVGEQPEETELPPAPREFRAAWIATVANIDWPSERGLSTTQQKSELRALLDRAAALNLNAVIFQVRPAADALYDSPYEPWSAYLTGQMGQAPDPYYYPLRFAVQEAHKRGLELHAWFNPYRAGHPADTSALAPNHISQTHPEYVRAYGEYLWLDPGVPEARAYTRRVILDVVRRYDIDGVHFDDYFYPYRAYADGADFPDSTSWQRARRNGTTMSRADWRRHNVDQLIEEVYSGIKAIKPHVKFGVSPFGIWRPGYPQQTTGFDAYNELYADARKWLREGWVDYMTPQIYYRMDQIAQPYPLMLRWWIEQNEKNRHIWPGTFTSRVRSAGERHWSDHEVLGQIYATRSHPEASGNMHFSMKALMPVPDRLLHPAPRPDTSLVSVLSPDQQPTNEPSRRWQEAQRMIYRLAAGPYAEPALIPASPWLDDDPPAQPVVTTDASARTLAVSTAPGGDEDVWWWVVRTRYGAEWTVDIVPGVQRTITLAHDDAAIWPEAVAISAVDRLGNESSPASVSIQRREDRPTGGSAEALKPDIIARDTWANQPPGGIEANAVRRNLTVGDTLRFRDATVVLAGMQSGVHEPAQAWLLPGLIRILPERATPDTARLVLRRHGVQEERKVPEGQAFNWNGYHLGILAAHPRPGGLGGGLTELEMATVASLSVDRAASLDTGGAAQRLRVPHVIRNITLHHSGSPEPLIPADDPVEKLQGLLSWGREARNWWDVPYHFLIDLEGRIYEGRDVRFAGETNTTYDPRGHLLISVLGNYNEQKPTDAQIDAITDLMAWAVAKYDVPLDHIGGHSDWADTSCPGRYLQKYLDDGTLVEAVRERVNGRKVERRNGRNDEEQ